MLHCLFLPMHGVPLSQDLRLGNTLGSIPLYASTDIRFELVSRHFVFEHLVDFFKRPVSCLWQKQNGEYHKKRICTEPNVPVLGRPAKFRRVDEVRSGKSSQPVADKVQCSGQTVCEGTKLIVGKLSTHEPSRWSFFKIRQISEFGGTSLTVCYVEKGEKRNEGNDGLSSYHGSRCDVPDNRHAKLANGASTTTDNYDCTTVDIACEA